MSSVKVSALTAKTSPSGSEELLINDGGTSKKITIANLPDTDTVYTHPNHSGDVVSSADGATTIQVDAVDIAMLSATGTASATTFLRGDNAWVVPTDTDTNTNQLTTFTVSATTDTTATTISQGDDLMFTAGTGITCETTADGTVTITNTVSDTDTVYTHPSHPGDDIDVDTTALTDAEVVSDIDINVTTDALGHVTDANGTVSTRTLTLANLGYTGSATANNYSHPNSDGDLHVPATSTTNNGKLLTAGSTAGAISWQDAPVSLPSQSGNSGKHLTTNGSAASWDDEITLSNWKITETGGVLYFSTGGVNKMKLDASGNLTVVGDVISNGTV
jgi:hypothetical protein